MKLLSASLFAGLTLSILVVSGCGSVFDSIFGDGDTDPPAASSGQIPGFTGGEDAASKKPCTGLCLQQKACANGSTTSLSGVIKDPAGKVPLYNVLVYVPNAPVAPIVQGASCDRCGSVSGDPLVTVLTGVDGKFKLDNVPVGANIPLVIQIGKWRRQLTIPNVPECTDTALADGDVRLPKKKSEGDIPQIALTTGGADTMECWLRKIGLDDSEFTVGTGDGRVHFYAGVGEGDSAVTKTFDDGPDFTSAQGFWSTQANLMKYDIVILSCEGITSPGTKPAPALTAMKNYADIGGRIFASHWHRYWFSTQARFGEQGEIVEPAGPPSPFEPMAAWNDRQFPCTAENCKVQGTINTSFPKGQAMRDWLAQPGVDALPGGTLPIEQPRHNVDSTIVDKATTWITTAPHPDEAANVAQAVEYMSFNTPIPAPDAEKCGRVVYSDLHVTTQDDRGPGWPNGCKTTDLTPQEKALEFMLFDLSSCIQSDKEPPSPPIGVK